MPLDGWSALWGIASIVVGARKLKNALNGVDTSVSNAQRRGRGLGAGAGVPGAKACPGDGSMPCVIAPAGSIENRAKLLAEKIRRDSLDPRVRRLAVKAVSEKCGDHWCTPPKDGDAEVKKVFGDLKNPNSALAKGLRDIEGVFKHVKSNMRYARDHYDTDQFQGALRSLTDFHGGDCDDHCLALGALLRSIGYPEKLRIYTLRGQREPGHIALRVNANPKGSAWMTLDASVDKVKAKNGRTIPVYPGWDAATSTSLIGSYKDYPV